MEPYRLLFSKNNVLITLMVLLPITGTGLLFTFMLSLPKDLPDWLLYAIIFAFLILMSLGLIFLIIKKITVPCDLVINEQGVSYQLEKKTIFYKRNQFFSKWEDIANISESNYSGKAFYRITFNNPNFTINLSPAKDKEDDAADFYYKISEFQDEYNLSHQNEPIQSKNFYQSAFARVITWFFYIMIIVVIVMYFTTTNMEWYRPISLFCFGIIWVGNYYRNTKKFF